jgi:hypothetical protein
VVFYNERGTKPLRMILEVLFDPLAGPLGKWPNERKRSLRQNPDVGFASGAIHFLPVGSPSSSFSGNRGAKFLKMFEKKAAV